MAEKTLKDMKNDFDEDALEKMGQSRNPQTGLPAKIKGVFTKWVSSKKAIMITVAGMVLSISLMTGGWLFLSKNSEKGGDIQKKTDKKEEVKTASPLKGGSVFEDIVVLKPFERIPLKKDSGMPYISMSLSLELTDGRFKNQVQAMEDKIGQIITGQVEEMTWLELKNPEGKIMLKYDLLKQMNSIFSEVMIRNIYFTNFLMQ